MAKIGQKVKGLLFTFLLILAIFLMGRKLARNTRNGQFRPGENVFSIVEVIEVHFRAFFGTSRNGQNRSKVKINPFTFWPILAIFLELKVV